MVVDLPMSQAAAGRAAAEMASALLIRALVGAFATVALLVVAALLYRHGVRTDTFPSYVAGTATTRITRFSAPWIAGAAGATLLAGLSFVSFSADLYRRMRLQRIRRQG